MMKRCLVAVSLGAVVLAYGSAGISYAEGRPALAGNATAGVGEELKQRFLAAIAKSDAPLTDVMEWQRLIALKYIERDTGLLLGADRAIEDSAVKLPDLKLAFRLETPQGLRKLYPDMGQLSFDSAAQSFGNPQMRNNEYAMLGFLMLTMRFADECRPGEQVFNKRFVKQVAAQPWKAKSEVLRYGVYFRLWDHKCISDKEFKEVTEPLMPELRKVIAGANRAPADAVGILFLLAASGRYESLDQVDLLRFARLQTRDGTWSNNEQREHASMNAAQGAYVLSKMVKKHKMQVSNAEVKAARLQAPVLPASTFQTKPKWP